ncbi:DUF1385 domain-containing protein [Desulfocurvus sp. DL9XJH121]
MKPIFFDRRSLLRALALVLGAAPTVGGQAVMEGVMMRNKSRLAIAVRKPDGAIEVSTRPWFSLTRQAWLKKPFMRGFPVLLETLVNGISSLNWSAQTALEDEEDGELGPWAMALTVGFALVMAVGMFVVLPHLFSLGMEHFGLGGDTTSLSFHVWDGFFKLAVFLGYIWSISFIPDIRRVFQYHGAEHKVIWAYESGRELVPGSARGFSRLHPRCGTAFLLFVLSLAIVTHAAFVPALLAVYAPQGAVLRQAYIIVAKILLMIPIAAMAFELIKFTGPRSEQGLCRYLCWPGLMLQRMTTFEPDDGQLEVAIAALKGALDKD